MLRHEFILGFIASDNKGNNNNDKVLMKNIDILEHFRDILCMFCIAIKL